MVRNYKKLADYVIRYRMVRWTAASLSPVSPWAETAPIKGMIKVDRYIKAMGYDDIDRWEYDVEEYIAMDEYSRFEMAFRNAEIWNKQTQVWDRIDLIDDKITVLDMEALEIKKNEEIVRQAKLAALKARLVSNKDKPS